MSTLVSIIIPAKGNLEYFAQTLESIEKSTYVDFEVVLIDDGISERALDFVSSYFSNKLNYKLIKNEGSGIVDALNTGINNSTGIYIARIDSDDYLMPERLQIQVEFLASNPLVGALGTQIIYIDEQGESKGISNYPYGHLTIPQGDFRFCPIAHPSTMLKREIIEEVEKYQSFLSYKGQEFAEDYYLWTRVSKITEIWNLNEPLTAYRQHLAQVSAVNRNVITLTSELVYLKIYDGEDQVSLPIILDSIDKVFIKQCVSLGIKKLGFLFGLHLYFRFLLTQQFPIFVRIGLVSISRVLAVLLRFRAN